ncbi:polyprenyl synthetase family protein [Natroniella sulfidigena]|uniref:polyprenyl synthetase family protein n=1 Tax=Natroniella sulfidigena TaxID=723921 RepID=UPI00200A84C5|nr:farnesyl diphosphate synthase [Natroniella sulfidigena]MCK8817524.1 polyprenyl synthetase family protein [Natroniella sulfidigena]
MNIKEFISTKGELINEALDRYLPEEKPEELHQAMRYSVLAGGKRLRPILTLVAAQLVGEDEEKVLPAACALELVHNYSLIHDDLPCMDDDEIRRGKPTNHMVFGEGMAVLAGDALLTYAFELLAKIDDLPAERVLLATSKLAEAAGKQGMVGGQVADILAEGKEIDKEELEYIHTHKTGALLEAAVSMGAILAGASKKELTALQEYAQGIGLAFQIVDDILDIEGDAEKIGKDVGSDLERDKATFPAVYGLERSKEMAAKNCYQAKKAISIFGDQAEVLSELADYIIEREY